jgi:hypothetical protein
MLLFLLSLTSGSCLHEDNLTESITFADHSVTPGETICVRNIPPRTSIIFTHFPPATAQVRYSTATSPVTRSGSSRTIGFDSADSNASLQIVTGGAGTFSYFAVTFPSDCRARIVSSQQLGLLTRTNTTEKHCYFNGGGRTISYDIQFSSNRTGRLASAALAHPLIGTAQHRLMNVNASIIAWEGEVKFVAIGLIGEWQGGIRGVMREVNGTDPAFIELATGEDSEPRVWEPDWWEDGTSARGVLEIIGAAVLIAAAVRGALWRRHRQQGHLGSAHEDGNTSGTADESIAGEGMVDP